MTARRRDDIPRRRAAPVMAVIAVMAVVAGCGGDAAPQLVGYELDPAPAVGDLSLDDAAAGETSSAMRADAGGLLITFLGFTNCPDVCPTTMASIAATLDALGDDAERVNVAMVTVDPARDTAAVLTAFVDGFVPGARALRSDDPAALRAVTERLGASYLVEEPTVGAAPPTVSTAGGHTGEHAPSGVGHTSYVYVLDDTGATVLVWPEGTSVDDMTSDLGILLDRLDTTT